MNRKVIYNKSKLKRSQNVYPFDIDEVKRRYREDPKVPQNLKLDETGRYFIPVSDNDKK